MIFALSFVIVILVAIILLMVCKWPVTIEISDVAPEQLSPTNNWLQLQNEGGKYVKVSNGKVSLKIIK